MQLFVRDLAGASHAITASSHADLVNQVTSTLDLQGARLSYGSRTLTSDNFDTLPTYATVDVSMRLRGGGPKKRCAHVYVKTGTTPSTSGVSTPKPAAAAAATTLAAAVDASAEEKKEEDKPVGDAEQTQQPPQPVEPLVERCSSAALRMIGDCPRCEKSFCGAHRLPEDHACPALANFRKAAFDENRAKLEKEATISSKISAF